MADENPVLLDLAASLADGEKVAWPESPVPADAEILHGLKSIEALIRAQRRLIAVEEDRSGPELTQTSGPSSRGTLADPEDPAAWGPLSIRGRLGRGAFGDVYRAHDPRLERDVALKLFHPDASAREGVASAVIEEGRLMARVRHPNVAVVYGAERHDGRVGLWMELIEGDSLASLLRSRGPMGANEAGLVGLDLCRALAAVHGQGLIHQDIKADNVLRERGGRIVLTDFGAGSDRARVRRDEGFVSGTPIYMAPEVLEGGAASPRSDLYSLGVLLFHLVSGAYPVSASSLAELRAAHARKAPASLTALRPDLPPPFLRVVERALAPNPADRFESAAAMERALASALGVEPSNDDRERPTRRPPWILWTVIAGAAGVLLAAWVLPDIVKPPERASATNPTVVAPPPVPRPASPPTLATGSYAVDAGFYRGTGAPRRLDDGARVAVGDALSLALRSSEDLWVYVVDEDDAGNAFLLFPIPGSDLVNPLPANMRHVLPGTSDGKPLHWRVTSAGGREHLLLVASPERLEEFEAAAASLPRASADRPLAYPRLDASSKVRLRGIGGLRAAPDASTAGATKLFELAERLATTPETVRGVYVRRVDLENPL